RILAGVEKFDLCAEHVRRALRLVAPASLDLLHRRARLLPGELALAALAERQAGNLDAITFLHMQRDRAARAPDEIAGMRRDHQARFASIAHDRISSLACCTWPAAPAA